MLFRLDEKLYKLQGKTAVEFGKGLHPKHRLTNYHNFFVQRIQPNQRVLDIGCGNGSVAYDVAERAGAQVLGIDLSEDNIAIAHDQYAHPLVRYVLGDALRDLPNETFDVVILSNVLEHMTNRSTFLQDIQETIHPKIFLLRIPHFERDWRVPLKKELGVEYRLDPTHEIEHTLDQFVNEINEARLTIIHLQVQWGEIWAEAIKV